MTGNKCVNGVAWRGDVPAEWTAAGEARRGRVCGDTDAIATAAQLLPRQSVGCEQSVKSVTWSVGRLVGRSTCGVSMAVATLSQASNGNGLAANYRDRRWPDRMATALLKETTHSSVRPSVRPSARQTGIHRFCGNDARSAMRSGTKGNVQRCLIWIALVMCYRAGG
ncbi:hypothetical protein SYNPS1DRAFT_28160 [Syncephalis pseudoplumigaleata]|uniref:Uncharacterized protein n=1 Tax=Syncephalis pseudoplumigaleata TaxID=1712513 RepID=A0A4P9Z101_9FUNG|nr:hypothetical protein SYNPS1DRAFT_28160 [Syncephalis pseudoplumigaleata]|eukprot:RKP26137.1 hypothetical protein SYNPS1DRAFT_28160 [Syncephalis pseudoplumigaleata]